MTARARVAAQWAWMALVAVFTVRFVIRHGLELGALDVAASWGTWLGGLAWILAAKVLLSLMVHAAWRTAGAGLDLSSAAYTYNLSQLPKYVPGGVWPYLNRVQLARARDVELPRIWGGLAVETAFLLGGALVMAVVALPDAVAVALGPSSSAWGWAGWARWLGGGALGAVWVAALVRTPRRRAFLAATAWALAAWACIGLSFHHVVEGMVGPTRWAPVAGIFSLAWAAGFVAVFSPAGLGVREGVLLAGMSAYGSPSLVAALVVVHRLLYVAADGVCALCAWLFFRGRRGA